MILDTLQNAHLYTGCHSGWARAFGFLKRIDLKELPDGKYPIDDDAIVATIARTQGRSGQEAQLEAHRTFIDIQYVIDGCESMGWHSVLGLTSSTEYDAEADIRFFHEAPVDFIRVPSGAFAVFFPTDAHMPLIGIGPIHKVVIKVPVNGS